MSMSPGARRQLMQDEKDNFTAATITQDQQAARRLRDRVAREMADCIDNESAPLAGSLLPVYRWLQAIAEPSTDDEGEESGG